MNFFEKRALIKTAKSDFLHFQNQCKLLAPDVNKQLRSLTKLASEAQANDFKADAKSMVEQAMMLKDTKRQIDTLEPIFNELQSDKDFALFEALDAQLQELNIQKANATKLVDVQEQYEERQSYRVLNMIGPTRYSTRYKNVTKERTVQKEVPDEEAIKPIDQKIELVQAQMRALPKFELYEKNINTEARLKSLKASYTANRSRIINGYADELKAQALEHKSRIEKLNRTIQLKENTVLRDADRAKNNQTAYLKAAKELESYGQKRFLNKNKEAIELLAHYQPFKQVNTQEFTEIAKELDSVVQYTQTLKQEITNTKTNVKQKTAEQ